MQEQLARLSELRARKELLQVRCRTIYTPNTQMGRRPGAKYSRRTVAAKKLPVLFAGDRPATLETATLEQPWSLGVLERVLAISLELPPLSSLSHCLSLRPCVLAALNLPLALEKNTRTLVPRNTNLASDITSVSTSCLLSATSCPCGAVQCRARSAPPGMQPAADGSGAVRYPPAPHGLH